MPRCTGTTRKGLQCARMVAKGCECYQHKTPVECPICFEAIDEKDVVKTPCNHSFHRICMLKWLATKNYSCPSCRGVLKVSREYINVYKDHSDVIRWIPKEGYRTTTIKTCLPIYDFPISLAMTKAWHISYVNKVEQTNSLYIPRKNEMMFEKM
jgi:hypothetical protein